MLEILELKLLPWLLDQVLVATPITDPKMVSSRTKWGGKQQVLRDNRQLTRRVRPMEQRVERQHSSLLRLYASLKNWRESFWSSERLEEVSIQAAKVLIVVLTSLLLIGSYGVVFKAMRTDPDDTDENGNRRQYAIKRIFPTINAAFILVEMLILKLVDGQQHNADLIQGFRLDG